MGAASTMEPALRGTVEHLSANSTEHFQRRLFVGNGHFTTPEEWNTKYDFVVMISYLNCEKQYRQYLCTGLIKDDIVVTAAHCAKKCSKYSDYTNVRTAQGNNFKVKSLIRNDKWDGNYGHGHDIMMLKVDGKFTNHVNFHFSLDRPSKSTKVDLLGFGMTETGAAGHQQPSITSSSLDVVGCPWLCGLSNNVMCMSSGQHSDLTSCQGDSGGAWFTKDELGRIVMVGINSFGYQRAFYTFCNPWYDGEKACGSHSGESGMSPISEDHDFIEKNAPGYFHWTDGKHDKKNCWGWWC